MCDGNQFKQRKKVCDIIVDYGSDGSSIPPVFSTKCCSESKRCSTATITKVVDGHSFPSQKVAQKFLGQDQIRPQ